MEHLEAYKEHCIDQAITILGAATISAACSRRRSCSNRWPSPWKNADQASARRASRASSPGGTEFTPQWTRFATEEFLDGVYMTPTYGNTLMGLACSKPVTAAEGYKITYYAPQPRAVAEVVDFNDSNRVVGYGETGRVKLTTLTKEFFVPGFLERDEGEREQPYEKYPVGRHQRRSPLPRAGRSHDGGCVLTPSSPLQ